MKTLLGTMQFGKPGIEKTSTTSSKPTITSIEKTKEILSLFYSNGFTILDTARMYSGGDTEEVLGEIGVLDVIVHTKAFPKANEDAGLTYDNVKLQLDQSLQALKRDYVELFYLHWPDHVNPIKESLRAVNDLYLEGKIKSFGLSNYASWQVSEIYQICEYEGWLKPSVYQGMYNAITRDIEKELIPCLRRYNMSFYAYNPLAGGLLAKPYKFNDEPTDGRFDTTTFWGQRYRERYWKKEAFGGLEKVAECCQSHSISTAEASIRWMYSHSALKDNDGVILGASSLEQLKDNLNAVSKVKEPLPNDIVEAFDEAWAVFKPSCPPYFR